MSYVQGGRKKTNTMLSINHFKSSDSLPLKNASIRQMKVLNDSCN